MAIAYVRKGTNSKTSTSTSTTVTISTDPGNLLVATCIFVNGSSSTALSSVSDTAGNTWTLPSSMSDTNPPAAYVGGLGSAIAYAEAADGITSVTFHYPSCAKCYFVVSEYSGAALAGARSTSGQSVSSSTDTITTPADGLCVAAACTSSATTISGGFTQLLKTSGNLAGYLIEGGSNASEHMGWTPTQNAAGCIIAFKPATATTTQGTAALTEAETLTGVVSQPLTAFLIEEDSLSAASSSNPQLAISAVPTDQTDAYGIPVRHGMTAYRWASSTATQYDRYASVQDGQLASGPYNAAADVNLYRNAADVWKTDDSLIIGGSLTVVGNISGKSTPSLITNGGSLTCTTTFQNIPNLTFNLAAGATYRFHGYYLWRSVTTTGATFMAGVGGTVTPSSLAFRANVQVNLGGGASAQAGNLLSNAAVAASAAAVQADTNYTVNLDGLITVSSAGTLTLVAKHAVATAAVQAGGVFVLEQIA